MFTADRIAEIFYDKTEYIMKDRLKFFRKTAYQKLFSLNLSDACPLSCIITMTIILSAIAYLSFAVKIVKDWI